MNSYSSIAYLGPAGTYSELALDAFFPESAKRPCSSISDVFAIVASRHAAAGLVPYENVLQGPVSETTDCLLRFHRQVYVVSSHVLAIRHALGAARDCAAVRLVYSHPQALQQCRDFLRTNFPEAQLVAAESTAQAILLASERTDAAVVAGVEALRAAEMTVLFENIADKPDNKTRFVVIVPGDIEDLRQTLSVCDGNTTTSTTAIALHPGKDRQGILFEILDIVSRCHQLNMQSIHSRPDQRGGFIFFLELEGALADSRIRSCLVDLQSYCQTVTAGTAELFVFGDYPREAFVRFPFSEILIVGGKGVMGRWFARFFRSDGLNVTLFDLDSRDNLAALAQAAEVIVLSVPISTAAEVIDQLLPALAPGQLVVENFSVKDTVISSLLERVPSGVEVLGIHTMFGGDVENIREQNIIVTPTAASGILSQSFVDLFYKHGARISTASVAQHDHQSAFVQALTQLIAIALAETLRCEFSNPEEIEIFSTPNWRSFSAVIERVLRQSDQLLGDLQLLNNKAPAVRQSFLRIFTALASELNSGSNGAFLHSVAESRKLYRH